LGTVLLEILTQIAQLLPSFPGHEFRKTDIKLICDRPFFEPCGAPR